MWQTSPIHIRIPELTLALKTYHTAKETYHTAKEPY
jgi:hypothetical protein